MLAEYTYDYVDQLAKETRYTYTGSSATPSSTTEVTTRSDTAGNLMAVITKVNGTQTSQIDYAYNDKNFADRLSRLTIGNVTRSIQYSDYCNPLNWFNGTDYTNLTWTQGRRLSSITKGDQTYSYEYDMSGVRSVKIAEGLKHEYVTQNGRVVRDYVTDASTGAYVRCLDFTYDESGHPLTMWRYYNESQTSYNTYHYVLNGQGDVVKLLHGPNKTVAEYTYDAWGNLLSVSPAQSDDPTIAAQNPLRYRGYYYDTETGFYYLQSRYYDPIVRRFINADSYGSTGTGLLGYNMFAYCENSPVNSEDQSGNRPLNVNTMMTDGGGGVIPPPIPTRTFDCEESAQAYHYHLKNTIESLSYPGKVIDYSLEKVGAPYTINKATRMAEATYDNTNNAMISLYGGAIAGGIIGSNGGPVTAICGMVLGGLIGWFGSQIYSYAKIQDSPLLPEGHYQSYELTVCSLVGYTYTPCGKQACYCYTETYFAIGTADYNSRFCIPFGSAQTSYSYSYCH